MSQIAPAAARMGPRAPDGDGIHLRPLAFRSVELSLQHLMTFPCVGILVEVTSLPCTAYFRIVSGRLLVRKPNSRHFEPVVDDLFDPPSANRL